mmetsp:Transcript_5255/g.15874  ORF Transcript_5255/g.15874 Transcript_5255/m.15874 type:complete len:221 (-) Transcript_5255:3033-3695(-)
MGASISPQFSAQMPQLRTWMPPRGAWMPPPRTWVPCQARGCPPQSNLVNLQRTRMPSPTTCASSSILRLLRAVVELHIVQCRTVPAPVLLHYALLQPAEPSVVVVPRVDRAVERVVERALVGALKREPVGALRAVDVGVRGAPYVPRGAPLVKVHVKHGVLEPAGVAHDGHRAVAHRNHLCQPTRLKHRRHDDDVGGGVDEVREWLVILEAEARNVAVVL